MTCELALCFGLYGNVILVLYACFMLVGVIFNNYKKVYCQKIAIVCPFRLLTPVLSKGGGQMQLPIDKF